MRRQVTLMGRALPRPLCTCKGRVEVSSVFSASGVVYTFFFFFSSHFYVPASGQAVVVSGVVPCPARYVPSVLIAHRVQYSHCSSIFQLLIYALALSSSQFVHKKSPYEYIRVWTRGDSNSRN